MKISEWVSTGHPDKLADHISEYLLDRFLEQDPKTRFALEVQVKDNIVNIGGELTTNATVNIHEATLSAIRTAGYTDVYCSRWNKDVSALITGEYHYNCISPDRVQINTFINGQSPDIKQGVDLNGWGDQGIMFGMATNHSEYDYMPKDFYMARRLGRTLYARAKEYGIGIDIKTQVVLDEKDEYKKIIVAAPMFSDTPKDKITALIRALCGPKPEIIINGTGKYERHSSMADCGTTGRKLAVDFYGGNCKIGGGSPWTKDGTKADLALNLYARYLALRHIMDHSGRGEVYVSIGCCIGKSEIDITVTDKTGHIVEESTEIVHPSVLIEKFHLDQPVFAQMNKDGLFSIVDKIAIQDHKDSCPATN